MPIVKWKLARRFAVPAAAAGLLLLALAYWWQSNLVHEIAGTVMFGFAIRHIVTNRRWFVGLARGRYDARRSLVAGLHLALAVNMLLLLGTSFAISQTVFAFLQIPDNVTVRDLHWVSAYWLVMTLGVHLGLHWTRVMAMTRSFVRVSTDNAVRSWVLRAIAFVIAVFGAWSCSIIGLGTKLSWNYSLDFWDFSQSVAPFFAHWAGVMALPAIITHYAASVALPRLMQSGTGVSPET